MIILGAKSCFATRLRELIEDRNISQARLAKALNTTPQAISSYVNKKTTPDYDMRHTIAVLFGVSTDYLLGVKHEKKEVAVMAREILNDEQVEQEILKLQESPFVKLANRERRVRNKRRMYLYHLRQLEKKGKELTEAGVTMEVLGGMETESDEALGG